jgi:ubiquitin carboxyl-terminal hydrolase 5/13
MQGGSAEAAIDWLFSHPDDQGDDGTAASGFSDAAVGTTSSATDKARGSKNLPAQYKLKAFISHKGKASRHEQR